MLHRMSLLKKNEKGLTRYPVTLVKWESTADIFLGMFYLFLEKLFPKKALNSTDYKGILFV